MNEFMKNPSWDRYKIAELSELLGLKRKQIYKWNWEQKKRLEKCGSSLIRAQF